MLVTEYWPDFARPSISASRAFHASYAARLAPLGEVKPFVGGERRPRAGTTSTPCGNNARPVQGGVLTHTGKPKLAHTFSSSFVHGVSHGRSCLYAQPAKQAAS